MKPKVLLPVKNGHFRAENHHQLGIRKCRDIIRYYDDIICYAVIIILPRSLEELKELANEWLLTVFADYTDHLSKIKNI